MKIQDWKNRKRVTLDPGEYYVTREDVLITTLLGSCVSACLYDPYTGIVGMNHFLLSCKRYARNMPLCITDAGRYGVHSMELLINEMWNRGAQRVHLKAKAFGGACIMKTDGSSTGNFLAVGEVNVRFIKEFLDNEGMPLVSSDLGGTVGRVINFYSEDFSVDVRKMIARGANVVKKEEQYWKKSVRRQEGAETQIDLW